MKKIFSTLLAATLMLLGTQAFAQMSVNGGYLNSTLATKNSSANANGAYAGISFNIPVAGGLGIAPGLYYSMVTGKTVDLGSILNGTLMEHAVNVPVYINYGIDLARDTRVFLFGGPTLQYGLSSKVKYTSGATTATATTDNYKNTDFNRMNVYLGGGIGFQVSAIQLHVGYDYGMMNQYKNTDNACHRSNLKLGVGFVF